MNNQSQQLPEQIQPTMDQGPDHGPRSGHELLSWIVIILASVVGAYFLNGYVSKLSEKGIEPPPVVNESAIDNSQSTIDTSTWQTYRNEEFGFEFRYPEDTENIFIEFRFPAMDDNFLIQISEHERSILGGHTLRILDVYPNPSNLTVKKWWEKQVEELTYGTDPFDTEYEDYFFLGKSGIKTHRLRGEYYREEVNLLSNGEYIFDFKSTNYVDQILSTFKFTETASIENKFLEYENKSCSQNNECGGFPCVNGTCLVKKCESDNDCPNNLCGLNLTPVPGYCTSIDVE